MKISPRREDFFPQIATKTMWPTNPGSMWICKTWATVQLILDGKQRWKMAFWNESNVSDFLKMFFNSPLP